MQFTVVVDGGGSGCRVGAFDADGRLCALASNGPASLTLGVEQAWRHISLALAELGARLDQRTGWLPSKLYLGLAGALQTDRCQAFLACVPGSVECTLVTDGQAQLWGASGGSAGACLAVGTGSVLHWLDDCGVSGHAGGWGFPAGDEASGAWLGRRLVNRYLWHLDGGSRATPGSLLQQLEQHIGTAVSDVQQWSTCKSPTQLASLALLLPDALLAGDPLAVGLVEEGAGECVRLIALAPLNLSIFVVGGLAVVYRQALSDMLGERLCNPHADALHGLMYLARQQQSA